MSNIPDKKSGIKLLQKEKPGLEKVNNLKPRL